MRKPVIEKLGGERRKKPSSILDMEMAGHHHVNEESNKDDDQKFEISFDEQLISKFAQEKKWMAKSVQSLNHDSNNNGNIFA